MSNAATRVCHFCESVVGAVAQCQTCTDAFPNRRDAKTMTVPERIEELEQWFGVLEIDCTLQHQRIEELMGRPVWTHEMGSPDSLYQELENGKQATMADVIGKVPDDKPLFVAMFDGDN